MSRTERAAFAAAFEAGAAGVLDESTAWSMWEAGRAAAGHAVEPTELVGFVNEEGLRLLRAGVPSWIYPGNIGDPSRVAVHRYV